MGTRFSGAYLIHCELIDYIHNHWHVQTLCHRQLIGQSGHWPVVLCQAVVGR